MLGFNSKSLTDKYKDAVQRFRDMQVACRENMKSKIKREIAYLDPEMTSREIENTVNNPEQLKKVMEQKMIGKTSVKVLNAVSDIKEKYNDILLLEQVLSPPSRRTCLS